MQKRPQDATDLTSLGWPNTDPDYRLYVREMLRGGPIRLRYVPRYSTCRVNHRETVAEHSFYVCLYAALIGQWLQTNPQCIGRNLGEPQWLQHRLNWELLMVRASIHDLEESMSGDMPRHFKYATTALLEAHEAAALAGFDLMISKLVSPQWASRLRHNWMLAKDSRLEGKVIAFADYLSVLAFIAQEYESGNRNAFEHAEQLRAYQRSFECDRFEPLRPLIEQVPAFIDEVFGNGGAT